MTIDTHNLICEKAKNKKDGVYSFRGNLYVVKDNKFLFYADLCGECYQNCYGFTVRIGKVDSLDRKKELLKLLKNQ